MPLILPDTTVLISFARVARIDLFAELVQSNGAWTYTIAEECARHASEPGLDGLHRVPDILGDPWLPSLAERAAALRLRARIAKPGDPVYLHQGESETIAIMLSRGIKGFFVTDDLAATDLARAPDIGITVYSTADLIRLAVRTKKIDIDTAWDMIELLRSHGRARGMPPMRERLSQWIWGN